MNIRSCRRKGSSIPSQRLLRRRKYSCIYHDRGLPKEKKKNPCKTEQEDRKINTKKKGGGGGIRFSLWIVLTNEMGNLGELFRVGSRAIREGRRAVWHFTKTNRERQVKWRGNERKMDQRGWKTRETTESEIINIEKRGRREEVNQRQVRNDL